MDEVNGFVELETAGISKKIISIGWEMSEMPLKYWDRHLSVTSCFYMSEEESIFQ